MDFLWVGAGLGTQGSDCEFLQKMNFNLEFM